MDPWKDPFDDGYQLTQCADGDRSRRVVRRRARRVSVQKLSYLPEAHTDFIFAVIAEELGFAGVCW